MCSDLMNANVCFFNSSTFKNELFTKAIEDVSPVDLVYKKTGIMNIVIVSGNVAQAHFIEF